MFDVQVCGARLPSLFVLVFIFGVRQIVTHENTIKDTMHANIVPLAPDVQVGLGRLFEFYYQASKQASTLYHTRNQRPLTYPAPLFSETTMRPNPTRLDQLCRSIREVYIFKRHYYINRSEAKTAFNTKKWIL